MENYEDSSYVAERLSRLEADMDTIKDKSQYQTLKIDKLETDLIAGMRAQESLLREVVEELKGQHASLKSSYERMNAFTRGVIWLSGIVAATLVLITKIDIRNWFG